MKLQYPFMQLPVSFDAAALAAEVGAIEESAWRPHPQGYPGNDALTLVTTGGDPDSDAVGGQMRATHIWSAARICSKFCPASAQPGGARGSCACQGRPKSRRTSTSTTTGASACVCTCRS